MPRVLRIINRFNLGGPTYNASYLTKYMAPEFETYLVGGWKDETEENSEFIVRNLGLEPNIIPEMKRAINPYKDYIAYQKIVKIIKAFRPHIVHTHASKAGALGRRAAYKMKVPVIVHTFHGHVFDAYFNGLKSEFYKQVERNLARKSTCIIALSEIQRNDLVRKYQICSKEQTEIIPLGFDLSRFRENKTEKRKTFRDKYLIEDDEIAIGIVGRVVPVKNHALFLKSIKYAQLNSPKRIRAFIVGDGEERPAAEALCRELKLDFADVSKQASRATISFTSWIKDIDQVNAGMDIIALTSLNEGTPVSLIEAQASGKAVVTTRVGGIENIVIPGKTALLADINNNGEFGEKLLELISNDELRQSLEGNGWEWVEHKFHYTRLVEDMKNLYNKLLRDQGII